jgi:hypothetical protein
MIGKMLLPYWGGTPAVWNTCLLFFQTTLLCGYLAAHGLHRLESLARGRMPWLTLLLLTGLVSVGYVRLPFDFTHQPMDSLANTFSPTLSLLRTLIGGTAVPLMLLAIAAPLLQTWFAASDHPRASDPYFFYAASNTGSLLSLVAYPFVIEPFQRLGTQSHVWRNGFLAFGILLLGSATLAHSRRGSAKTATLGGVEGTDTSDSFPRSTWLRCLLLMAIASSWLMGVTTYLTTDLAAMPLLWVIPLVLYLLSFIIAFANPTGGIVRLASIIFPYVVLPWTLVMAARFPHAAWIPLHLLLFFSGAVVCHGALAGKRPSARHLSAFYVIIGVGGLLGGAFNTLVAPLLFDRLTEYPLAVLLACTVPAWVHERAGDGRSSMQGRLRSAVIPLIIFVLVAMLATNRVGLADSLVGTFALMTASGLGFLSCVTARRRPVRFACTAAAVLLACELAPGPSGRVIHTERNFFGILRVTIDPERNVHRLFHGSTLHGQQSLDPVLKREPSTYFSRSGPMGQILASPNAEPEPGQTTKSRVAVVGLGAGTLACYARPGEQWSFYEIDPAVERIAHDPRYFTYLEDCRARSVEVLLGDARIRLREAPDHAFRAIILDAFSSDSLPVHLLTREAIELYLSKLEPDGVIAFNLTNRYLDLGPLIARQAADAQLLCLIRHDLSVTDEQRQAGKQPSIWAMMSQNRSALSAALADPRWSAPKPRPGSSHWTDDYSDLASYLLLSAGSRRAGGAESGAATTRERP